MRITATGHWRGNVMQHTGRLSLHAENQAEAKQLALLLRVLSEPEQRARLLRAAAEIEASAGVEAELVGC